MERRKQTPGPCGFCGKSLTRSGMAKHLASCPQRAAANASAAQKPGPAQTLYHLQAQDAIDGTFWLQLEVNGAATLAKLDHYLRAIWLECCGHLSQFSVGGWRGEAIAPGRRIEKVVQPGVELTHIYDFGTSSETLIKLVATRSGQPLTKHPISLLARNSPPTEVCQECGQPAAWLCVECVYEDQASGMLCAAHADGHPHDDYGEPMPLVNSPRVGLCGYEGPANPPY